MAKPCPDGNQWCPVGCPESHDALNAIEPLPHGAPQRHAFLLTIQYRKGEPEVCFKFTGDAEPARALSVRLDDIGENGAIYWHRIDILEPDALPGLAPMSPARIELAVRDHLGMPISRSYREALMMDRRHRKGDGRRRATHPGGQIDMASAHTVLDGTTAGERREKAIAGEQVAHG